MNSMNWWIVLLCHPKQNQKKKKLKKFVSNKNVKMFTIPSIVYLDFRICFLTWSVFCDFVFVLTNRKASSHENKKNKIQQTERQTQSESGRESAR